MNEPTALGRRRVLAIFRYRAEDLDTGLIQPLWVVAGDLPTAGLEVQEDDSLIDALERYADYAEEWATCAVAGDDETECYPFEEEQTPELGEKLAVESAVHSQ